MLLVEEMQQLDGVVRAHNTVGSRVQRLHIITLRHQIAPVNIQLV